MRETLGFSEAVPGESQCYAVLQLLALIDLEPTAPKVLLFGVR